MAEIKKKNRFHFSENLRKLYDNTLYKKSRFNKTVCMFHVADIQVIIRISSIGKCLHYLSIKCKKYIIMTTKSAEIASFSKSKLF